MIDIRLNQILDERPSAIRNSMVMGLVQGISILLCIGFVALAVVSFVYSLNLEKHLSKLIGNEYIGKIVSDEDQVSYLLQSIAAISVLIAVLFAVVIKFSNMIIKRNRFIFKVLMWHTDLHEKLTNPQNESAV